MDANISQDLESRWSGSVEDAFFNGGFFDRARKLQLPEYEAYGRNGAQTYYVISVDVGRRSCQTAICVFKVTPQA